MFLIQNKNIYINVGIGDQGWVFLHLLRVKFYFLVFLFFWNG